MNQNSHTTTPAGAATTTGWMLRIKTALQAGRKPTYDDLEEAVLLLLSERAALCWVAAEAEAAFDFIEQDFQIIDVKRGVVGIRLELDCEVFTHEGARGAIAAKIAALQAARKIAAPSEKEAAPAFN